MSTGLMVRRPVCAFAFSFPIPASPCLSFHSCIHDIRLAVLSYTSVYDMCAVPSVLQVAALPRKVTAPRAGCRAFEVVLPAAGVAMMLYARVAWFRTRACVSWPFAW